MCQIKVFLLFISTISAWNDEYEDITHPVSPQEVESLKISMIPDRVFQEVNKLLAVRFINGVSDVYKHDLVNIIGNSSVEINLLLDLYRRKGWKIKWKIADNEKIYYDFSFYFCINV